MMLNIKLSTWLLPDLSVLFILVDDNKIKNKKFWIKYQVKIKI